MKKIIIIGAGVAGVYLSILLKKQDINTDVTILEANATALKKLLATGNGRCNLSNRDLDVSHYDTDNISLTQSIIDHFNMIEEMEKLGLYTKYLGSLLYPRSEQAKSVKAILLAQAEKLGVTIVYNEMVESIEYNKQYIVHTHENTYTSEVLVLAMGSPAGKLSGEEDRENILKNLYIDFKPMRPSLTQMKTEPVFKNFKGIRLKGCFKLLKDNEVLKEETGELLFTDYGVSGIAIMQLSRYFTPGCTLEIDMMPEYSYEEVKQIIKDLQKNNLSYEGLVPDKMVSYIACQPLKHLKKMTLHVKGLRENAFAQVCKGGISLRNLKPNLEFKKYPHLYACGEILNVTGDCGGYNLHFAFASAKTIANDLKGK